MSREISPFEALVIICARFIMGGTIQTIAPLKSLLGQGMSIFGKMKQ